MENPRICLINDAVDSKKRRGLCDLRTVRREVCFVHIAYWRYRRGASAHSVSLVGLTQFRETALVVTASKEKTGKCGVWVK